MTTFAKMKIWSVYVMAAPCHDGSTFFKVGRTSDIAARICSVQTGCPLKISKAWVLTLWGNGASQSLERQLQHLLMPFHSHGEWYRMDTADPAHKAAMNQAFEDGRKFASQMVDVKWRELGVSQLREAVAALNAERAGERKESVSRVRAKAFLDLAKGRRQVL